MIQVHYLSIAAGAFALGPISFAIDTGQYAVLMGRTGTGKTTLLEALCGLRIATAGRIFLQGHDVTHLKPAARGISYVPQDRVLFSTMSVRDNLAFSLYLRHWPRREIDARIRELADLLQISHLLHRRPQHLSGGEAQRVALGRALAPRPALLLLDEPLSALDDETRQAMLTLLQTIHAASATTILHVTHNLQDAATLAQRWFIIDRGTLTERPLPQSTLPNSPV